MQAFPALTCFLIVCQSRKFWCGLARKCIIEDFDGFHYQEVLNISNKIFNEFAYLREKSNYRSCSITFVNTIFDVEDGGKVCTLEDLCKAFQN